MSAMDRFSWKRVFYVFLLVFINMEATAFVAYECGNFKSNYTAISLIDVQNCDDEPTIIDEDDVLIQLLQPRSKIYTETVSCKIEILYIVYYCGMHSHSSIVKGGIVSKLATLTSNECFDIHKSRSFQAYGQSFKNLQINQTVVHSVNFAGYTSSDGSCSSERFIDGEKNWGQVAATGQIKISLFQSVGVLNSERREVRLPSGTVCPIDGDDCVDNDHGQTFWNKYTRTDCDKSSFHVLYRGMAKRARVKNPSSTEIMYIYTVTEGSIIFTLTSNRVQFFCFITLRITDHPKLLIHEVHGDNFFFSQEEILPLDMDMFLYVNTKFLHLERSLSKQMGLMYKEIVQHRCEQDRKILNTKLTTAIISPMEFAFDYMRSPGYTASILGEVIYIIKCQPVEVIASKVDDCTLEMPVSYKNVTMYMRPRNRILQRIGTPTPCDGMLKPKYHIGGEWFSITPALHSDLPPEVLAPDSVKNWRYTSPGELITSGIYTSDQIDRLREQIMAPIERRTKGDRFASLLNSERSLDRSLDLSSLTGEAVIEQKISRLWDRTWNFATVFGNVSAAVLGLVFIFKLIKFMLDTFIHAITLKEVYGCTWFVFGSLWDALTTYLLIKADKSHFNKPSAPSERSGEEVGFLRGEEVITSHFDHERMDGTPKKDKEGGKDRSSNIPEIVVNPPQYTKNNNPDVPQVVVNPPRYPSLLEAREEFRIGKPVI